MFEPKQRGIKVNYTGLIDFGESKKFEEEGLPEACGGLTYEELVYVYDDLKCTRKHMLNYVHDASLKRKLSLEDAQERWGQINSIEAVIRFIRDVATIKANKLNKKEKKDEQD